jgi:hypothetical protein
VELAPARGVKQLARMKPLVIAACVAIAFACDTRADSETAMTDDFAIHVVRRSGAEPTDADPNGEWPRFLATAPLGDVLVRDTDIEAVTTEPLTLVLGARAGAEVFRAYGNTVSEHRFVVTLGANRLFAGRIVFVGTARALHHPVIHIDDTGFAVTLVIKPTLGATRDSEVTAPREVLDHFRRDGRLLDPGALAAPPATYRRWLAEATSGRPGEPASRLEAECRGAACAMRISFRRPGRSTWDQSERVALDRAEFDAVWDIVQLAHLVTEEPKRSSAEPPLHPTRWRWRFTLERTTGERIDRERAWRSPSTADGVAEHYFRAAAAVAQRVARTVPVRYFPDSP